MHAMALVAFFLNKIVGSLFNSLVGQMGQTILRKILLQIYEWKPSQKKLTSDFTPLTTWYYITSKHAYKRVSLNDSDSCNLSVYSLQTKC